MDKILQGIIQSSHPEGLKRQLIGQVTNAADQPQNPQTITRILELSFDIILQDRNQTETKQCQKVYKVWAKSNRSTFEKFFTPERAQTLMDKTGPKASKAVWILHESLLVLRSMGSRSLPGLYYVVEASANIFIRENRTYNVICPFCDMIRDFRECIPKKDHTVHFCNSLISSVSVFSAPLDANIKYYITSVNIIGELLGHIWQHSPTSCVYTCLGKIFHLISYIDENDIDICPSYALAGIVTHIPDEIMGNVVKKTVEDTSIPDKNMSVALARMIDWLNWPSARNIDAWIVSFLRGLAVAHKYSILIEVTEIKVEWVYERIHFPVVKNGAFRVLSVMLLSFQHSPAAFHKIIEQVPRTINHLKKERTDENYKFMFRLVDLIHCLIQMYPGFPDLYEPVLDTLKDLPKPTPEKIRSMVDQYKWNSHQATDSVTSTNMEVLRRKSETGKTGLVNLGNTCYMNSVLQALYMCDSFRRNILTASLTEFQGLLYKLQQAYAFLSTTQRAAYAPNPFLIASRPPWFNPGCQQDCSEFLRYLLDQLHEQQLNYLRKEQANSSTDTREKTPPTPEKTSKWKLRSKSAKSSPRPIILSDDEKLEPTLVQETFEGKLKTTNKCLKCKTESSRCENFTDLSLAFPEKTSAKKSKKSGDDSQEKTQGSQETPTREVTPLEDLISYCLQTEKLEGDNKYHCDKCKGLQDGERSLKIVDSPDYLILTLLRFAYDAKRKTRSKIFTDVKYPRTLYLPVSEDDSNPGQTTGTLKRLKISKSPPQSPVSGASGVSNERLDVYSLCAVVVHSGISSDGGHYYCYARHSIPVNQSDDSSPSNASIDEIDYLQDKWYLFNDNRVTYSSYSSFSNVTQKFSRDTAYVLLYKKICPEDLAAGTVDANETIMPAAVDPPLRSDLRAVVEKDNKLYLQEQELQQRSRALKKSSASTTWYTNFKDNDDGGPPGSCGGFGGLSGSRLVF